MLNVLRKPNNMPDIESLSKVIAFELEYSKLSREEQMLFSTILGSYEKIINTEVIDLFPMQQIFNYAVIRLEDAMQITKVHNNRRVSKMLKSIKNSELIGDYTLAGNVAYIINIENPEENTLDTETQKENILDTEELLDPFAVSIPLDVINCNQISYKALGIYAEAQYILNNKDIKLEMEQLVNFKKDGKAGVTSGIAELEQSGFVKIEQHKNDNGHNYNDIDLNSSICRGNDSSVTISSDIFECKDIKYKTLGVYIELASGELENNTIKLDYLIGSKTDKLRSIETSLAELESSGYLVKNTPGTNATYKLISRLCNN